MYVPFTSCVRAKEKVGQWGGGRQTSPHHYNNKIFNLNMNNIWNFSLFIKQDISDKN